MIKKLLQKYATIEWVQRLVANELPLEDATRQHAGLMSAKDALKLGRIEEGAQRNATPDEIAAALMRLKPFLNATTLEGHKANDFADAQHGHADYVVHSTLERMLRSYVTREDVMRAARGLHDQAVALEDADKYLRLDLAKLADALANHTDAKTLDGLSLSKLDERYAEQKSVKTDKPAERGAGETWATVKIKPVRDGAVFTPNPARGRFFRVPVGKGGGTLAAPIARGNYHLAVMVDWTDSEGVLYLTGFTTAPGGVIRGDKGTNTVLEIKKIDEFISIQFAS